MALTITKPQPHPQQFLNREDLRDGMIVRDVDGCVFIVNFFHPLVAFSVDGHHVIAEDNIKHYNLVEVDAELIIKS